MKDKPEQTPTPRTDDAQFGTGRVSVNFARQLETELAAVTEQLKSAQDGWHDEITKGLSELRRAESIYTKAQERAERAEEQRDRLAEALERIKDYQGRFGEDDPTSIATEALQSLN